MKNYNLIEFTKYNELDKLFDTSAATILGAGGPIEDWIIGIQEWIKENQYGEAKTFYLYSGKLVNIKYGLTGDNAFKDDLTILSYELDNVNQDKYGKYCIDRLQKGIRWFDDIINNSVKDENI